MKRPHILVCNDDGIHGPGLPALIAAMKRLGTVTVAVPEHERSADSHSLTLHKPIRVRKVSPGVFTLNGSPADCARFALLEILRGKADFVASGINRGFNLGEDVVYSGTVAAAREATMNGARAAAFSADPETSDYRPAADYARKVARLVLGHGLPSGVFLNVNFPVPGRGGFKGAAPVRLGKRVYDSRVTRRADPRGLEYYWLAGQRVSSVDEPGTDVAAASRGFVSVTPLLLDATALEPLKALKSWPL
ncbi:MAG: 5'/3'-nucleotidase SurE [Elusimicrobiota bacterium]|nr:5'/3'-nucleotidase SurE [Elusimicrobiota bacterium]